MISINEMIEEYFDGCSYIVCDKTGKEIDISNTDKTNFFVEKIELVGKKVKIFKGKRIKNVEESANTIIKFSVEDFIKKYCKKMRYEVIDYNEKRIRFKEIYNKLTIVCLNVKNDLLQIQTLYNI